MTLEQFLRHAPRFDGAPRIRQYAVCGDRYRLSIQDDSPESAANVEVALAERRNDWFEEHGFYDGGFPKGCWPKSVYQHVPKNALDTWLEDEHGGIAGWTDKEG